jgi:HlyD family type I secretion membrane fusion protein
MKLDLTPVRSSYVTPTFGGDERMPVDAALQKRLRRPMITGAIVIGVLVIGLGTWASLSSVSTGITAPGEVKVESNIKTIRHRETGIVRQILVQEGQRVRAGQPLVLFNDVEARAAYDVMQNQYDALLAQAARFTAEATNQTAPQFSPELMARMSDPRVAGLIRDQQFLFTTRTQLYQSQVSILNQRLDQIQSQIQGDQVQVDSVETQTKLTNDEMAGYQKLYDQGYAAKSLILRYQRQVADLEGRKGSLLADMARLRQQMGETKMQMSAQRDTRESQAAEGLRDTQARLADSLPRLTATRQTLEDTVARSPVDGIVFNQAVFTPGGVTGSGEDLMQVVPADAPLIVTVAIRPEDVDKVHVGMSARVKFTGLNQRWHAPLPAKVILVGADKLTNQKSAVPISTYRVDLRIDPKELTKLKQSAQITPGMPVQAMIVSGEKTVMGSLISPITDTLHDALHDQ